MKLNRTNKYMFQAVVCHAYLRRIKDGKYFYLPDDSQKPWLRTYFMIGGYDDEGNEISKECKEYDGSERLLKTYYERTEIEFCGVVVGTTMVTTQKWLYADTCQPAYGKESRFIGKKVESQVKCARVFYGNNRSRLVPLKDLEITEDKVL